MSYIESWGELQSLNRAVSQRQHGNALRAGTRKLILAVVEYKIVWPWFTTKMAHAIIPYVVVGQR